METYDIVPTHLVVKAMRDNGYKNAAYAIAELMDNSIQAGADHVELLCFEDEVIGGARKKVTISEIAVLDNGSGMNSDVLQIALQFGNGTRLEQHTGIGKFGMGLPNSSISQAKRVDVWSWKDGPENALHSYIDVIEIASGKLKQVPTPEKKKIPKKWLECTDFGNSGTLVVWSTLDKIIWRKAETVINNSELLIGRMYRYFLLNNSIKISLKGFREKSNNKPFISKLAKPNDPLYLINNTSCPEPFHDKAMFSQGEYADTEYKIRHNDKFHLVKIKFSFALELARTSKNPGALPHGQHAKKNVGVSIVRADRELDLDPSWSDPSDPRDRWWGVEVSFPPDLDEMFGVTNNKQAARNFSDLAKVDLSELADDMGVSLGATRESLNIDEDPRLPLLEIANHVRTQISTIRRIIKAQTANKTKSGKKRHSRAEEIGTDVTNTRIEGGFHGQSDDDKDLPDDEKIKQIRNELEESGVPHDEANEIAVSTVQRKLKYKVVNGNLSGPAFFDVKPRGGAIVIALNIDHPAYAHLVELLSESGSSSDTVEDLQSRLEKAKEGLELLIMAWARYEDEQPPGKRRDAVQEARWDWGRMAKDFLVDSET